MSSDLFCVMVWAVWSEFHDSVDVVDVLFVQNLNTIFNIDSRTFESGFEELIDNGDGGVSCEIHN